jgi:hypothetical protein
MTVVVGQNGPWVFGTLIYEGVKLGQDRQCKHNIILIPVLEIIFAVESNENYTT